MKWRRFMLSRLWILSCAVSRAATASPTVDTAVAHRMLPVISVPASAGVRVDLAELARRSVVSPPGVHVPVGFLAENPLEAGSAEGGARGEVASLPSTTASPPARLLQVPSPGPARSFAGLDDIPMADSALLVVPPDGNGAVGLTRIFQNLKNNVRILDKSTGSALSTVGVNTFWAPAGASANRYSDPRSTYDPYHGRFITIMLADLGLALSNSIVLGVSDSDDPGGSWHLYRFLAYENNTFALGDFPTLGFNRNWITIGVNMYAIPPAAGRRSVFMIHYPTLLNSQVATVYRADDSTPDLICAAPCVTLSATCDTQYVVQRRGTSSYSLDRVTGVGPGAPAYAAGPALLRPGGDWNSLSSIANSLPQSAPEAGVSSCGSPPCAIERSDDHVRTPPVYRGGSIWFAQQVGLPAASPEYVAVQWTQIRTPDGACVAGGRLQDTLATVTNGRPHYSYPSIAVNANGDFLLGFNRFSSSEHPAAGYAIHLASDGPGTLRDPVIFKDGEDYYRKVASSGSSRNRWGDFSTSQVDPSDDLTLWTVQEYAKSRIGVDDGNTITNSSRWGTWWAAVTPGTGVAVEPDHPAEVELLPVAPNPGAGTCVIRFALPTAGPVSLRILDLEGRVVATLEDGAREAGPHATEWSGDTPSGRGPAGIYFVRLETRNGTRTGRFALLR